MDENKIPDESSSRGERMYYFIYKVLGSNAKKVSEETGISTGAIRNAIGSVRNPGDTTSYRFNEPSAYVMDTFQITYPNLNTVWWYSGKGDPLVNPDIKPTAKPDEHEETTEVDEVVIDNIKALRAEFNLTQDEFAHEVKTTRTRINNIELYRNNPSLKLIRSIVEEFNVSYEQIFVDYKLVGNKVVLDKAAKERIEYLEDLVKRQDEEIVFLRGLTKK